jgi:hypothetical protein
MDVEGIPELERIFIQINNHRFLHRGDKLGWIVRHLNQVVRIDDGDLEKKENDFEDFMGEEKKNGNGSSGSNNNDYLDDNDNNASITTEEGKKREKEKEEENGDVEIESANMCRRIESMHITRMIGRRRHELKEDQGEYSGEKLSTTSLSISRGKLTSDTDVVFYGASYNLVVQLDVNMSAMSVNSNNGEVLYMTLRNV